MKITFSTRLWLAWQVLRSRVVSASWESHGGGTTIHFVGNDAFARTMADRCKR